MRTTLPDLFADRSPSPDAAFLHEPGGGVTTYAELETEVERWASGLWHSGVRRGERVAYQVQKSPAVLTLHLALLRCGAVLADAEPTIVVRDPGASVLAGPWTSLTLDASGEGTARDLRIDTPANLPRLEPDDGAALLYTSGTTGRPKGALLTHANLAHNAAVLVDLWGFTQADVLLHVLPLFHTHGLFVATHCVLASGASMVLLPTFEVAAALRAVPQCTVMMGVPTHYSRLLSDSRLDADLVRGMRLFVSGSAPMPVQLHEAFTERTGRTILERYGMTETSMLTSNALDGVRKPGSVGTPLPGVELRVADGGLPVATGVVGQVEVRGPNVFGGYWRRPELAGETFTDDGFFRTGDLGRIDGDGYLELVGRSKDLVISGGLNVYPRDVEEVLDGVAGVRESAVVGVPDSDLGERVVAMIVGDPGIDPENVRAAVRERLAGYKVPKRIHLVDELPRNAMGKVDKVALRATAIELGA
jgi:malonyl-CoA/methylmalonyl-CoA synthetase